MRRSPIYPLHGLIRPLLPPCRISASGNDIIWISNFRCRHSEKIPQGKRSSVLFLQRRFTDGIRIQEAATADYEWTEYAGEGCFAVAVRSAAAGGTKTDTPRYSRPAICIRGQHERICGNILFRRRQLLGNLAETFSVSVYKRSGESEQSATDGTLVYRFERETQSYIVTGIQEGVIREVTIPETFRDYPVTEIAPNAFSDSYIQSITIGQHGAHDRSGGVQSL